MNVAMIMRTKDRPLLLPRAIDSLLAQTYRDWELVVVNDGGDKAAVEPIVDERRERLAGRVTVVHNDTPTGRWKAANQGIAATDSRYVTLFDDDDTLDPRYLERTIGFLDGPHPERFRGIVTNFNFVHEEIRNDAIIRLKTEPAPSFESISILDVLKRRPTITYATMIYDRAVYDDIGGGFRDEFQAAADWEFFLRFMKRYDVWVITQPLINYHIRKASESPDYENSVFQNMSELHVAAITNDLIRADVAQNRLSWAQLLEAANDAQGVKDVLQRIDRRVENLDRYAYKYSLLLKKLNIFSGLLGKKR